MALALHAHRRCIQHCARPRPRRLGQPHARLDHVIARPPITAGRKSPQVCRQCPLFVSAYTRPGIIQLDSAARPGANDRSDQQGDCEAFGIKIDFPCRSSVRFGRWGRASIGEASSMSRPPSAVSRRCLVAAYVRVPCGRSPDKDRQSAPSRPGAGGAGTPHLPVRRRRCRQRAAAMHSLISPAGRQTGFHAVAPEACPQYVLTHIAAHPIHRIRELP